MKFALRVLAAAWLAAGSVYAQRPANQLVSFRTTLSPANEAPPVTGITASAEAIITLSLPPAATGGLAGVFFDIQYSFSQAVTITGLHIHNGAAGVNGPIVIESGITPSNTVAGQGVDNLIRRATVEASSAVLAALQATPQNYYVNLHTSDNPGGLMRGQLQAIAVPAPLIYSGGIVNNASYASAPAPLAPGAIAALFGKYLNDGETWLSSSFGSDGKLITNLGLTQITVNGIAAPVYYSTFSQAGFQIPEELAGQTSASVRVSVQGRTSNVLSIALEAAAPGLFAANNAGTGSGAILHQDGITPVTAQNPAQPNEVIILFGTGLGAASPPLATGAPSSGNRAAATPTVMMDGVPVTIEFAGRAPGFVGLDQLNVRVPASMRSAADLPLEVRMAARSSNMVTTAVRQPDAPPANNPVPTLNSLTPTTATEGDLALTLTLRGAAFLQASTASFAGADRTVNFASDTELRLLLTAADLSRAGTFPVVVTNPAPGGGNSNVLFFTVNRAQPPDPYDY